MRLSIYFYICIILLSSSCVNKKGSIPIDTFEVEAAQLDVPLILDLDTIKLDSSLIYGIDSKTIIIELDELSFFSQKTSTIYIDNTTELIIVKIVCKNVPKNIEFLRTTTSGGVLAPMYFNDEQSTIGGVRIDLESVRRILGGSNDEASPTNSKFCSFTIFHQDSITQEIYRFKMNIILKYPLE